MTPEPLRLEPIGYLRTTAEKKYQLPPQPSDSCPIEGVIELLPNRNFEIALRDLDGFSRIWLIWWFHRNQNWRPTTLPPRGRGGRVGTFASRSPYRPNPLAISNVRLLHVKDRVLYIGRHDLLDDTPILDIKPYIPEFDSFPDESAGWYQKMTSELPEPSYQVRYSELAAQVLENRPQLRQFITETLALDPFPHRTRRIVPYDSGYRIALGEWRAYFKVQDSEVMVEAVEMKSESNSER